MTCPLPNDSIVNAAIGYTPVHVKYEIAYDEKILISKAVHPPMLDNFLNLLKL